MEIVYSNTTLVKVKLKDVSKQINRKRIQIQLLLKLNITRNNPNFTFRKIQIQLLLKLNLHLLLHGEKRNIYSNTTLVKVKLLMVNLDKRGK